MSALEVPEIVGVVVAQGGCIQQSGQIYGGRPGSKVTILPGQIAYVTAAEAAQLRARGVALPAADGDKSSTGEATS